jgi:hypothetical protein
MRSLSAARRQDLPQLLGVLAPSHRRTRRDGCEPIDRSPNSGRLHQRPAASRPESEPASERHVRIGREVGPNFDVFAAGLSQTQ